MELTFLKCTLYCAERHLLKRKRKEKFRFQKSIFAHAFFFSFHAHKKMYTRVQKGIFFLLCILFNPKEMWCYMLGSSPLVFQTCIRYSEIFIFNKTHRVMKAFFQKRGLKEKRKKNQKGVTNSQLSDRKMLVATK